MKSKDYKRITQFFFEIGTLRKLLRIHRQTLLTDDMSDNISSHSYRVALIGWNLAKLEGADPYKTVMMCLVHDLAEARSGDQNWVHKRYVKVFEDEIRDEQLGELPFPDLALFSAEYEERHSLESKLAKDADILDQILLLREYEWQGNEEAKKWLRQKADSGAKDEHRQLSYLNSESAKKLGEIIYEEAPGSWWDTLWTKERR